MDLQKLLGQFLGVPGQGSPGGLGDQTGRGAAPRQGGGLESLLGSAGRGSQGGSGGSIVDQLGGMLQGRGGSVLGGALAGGFATQLFKGKGVTKMGGTALKIGGAAIVAGLAYKAYQSYQQNNGAPGALPAPTPPPAGQLPSPEGTKFLPRGQEEAHAALMLSAMIAAAKADGYIDQNEEEAIFGRIDELDLDAEEKGFVMDEMRHPKSISDLTAHATTDELKMEVYTASVLAIDADHPAEQAYLDRLANALGLPAALTAEIHSTAKEVQD